MGCACINALAFDLQAQMFVHNCQLAFKALSIEEVKSKAY